MMKVKPVLIIVGSLLIGIIIGFLASAQLRHKRMKPVRVLTTERYFRDVLYGVIEPDDELKSKLEPVFEKYGNEGREKQIEFRKWFATHNENYWKEIKEVLSDEQIEKLEDFQLKMGEERNRFRSDTTRERRGDWDRRGGPQRGHGHRKSGPDSLRPPSDTMPPPPPDTMY